MSYSLSYHLSWFSRLAHSLPWWGWLAVFVLVIFGCYFLFIAVDDGLGSGNWVSALVLVLGVICLVAGFESMLPLPSVNSAAGKAVMLGDYADLNTNGVSTNVASDSGKVLLHLSFTGQRVRACAVGRAGKAYLTVVKYVNKNGYTGSVHSVVASGEGTRCRVNSLSGEKTIIAYSNGRKTETGQKSKTIVLPVK